MNTTCARTSDSRGHLHICLNTKLVPQWIRSQLTADVRRRQLFLLKWRSNRTDIAARADLRRRVEVTGRKDRKAPRLTHGSQRLLMPEEAERWDNSPRRDDVPPPGRTATRTRKNTTPGTGVWDTKNTAIALSLFRSLTLSYSFALLLSRSLAFSLSPPAVVEFLFSCMISWFSNSTSLICLSHGGGSLARFSQNHAEQDVDSELVSQLRPSHRRWIVKPCQCSFPSTNSSHPRATPHCLNNKISRQAYRRASSLDQPQNGSGQYQPTGNDQTPLAGDDLTSTAIVDAQLTHLISRDDAAQGQDAPHDQDTPMPDAPTVHDIATPRRTIGGRCREWCISAQPASGKRKCARPHLRATSRWTLSTCPRSGDQRRSKGSTRWSKRYWRRGHCKDV